MNMQLNLPVSPDRIGMPQFISTQCRHERLGIEPNKQYIVFDQRLRGDQVQYAFFVDDERYYWTTLNGSILIHGNNWKVD